MNERDGDLPKDLEDVLVDAQRRLTDVRAKRPELRGTSWSPEAIELMDEITRTIGFESHNDVLSLGLTLAKFFADAAADGSKIEIRKNGTILSVYSNEVVRKGFRKTNSEKT